MKLPVMFVSLLFLLPSPPSQTQQQPQKGSIEGTIVRVGTGEPIAGARAVLARAPAAGPLAGSIPSVATDSQGKFLLTDLDSGSYRLTIVANGYARQEYGQRVPGTQGTLISLVPGQRVKDVIVRLTPTGNVSGRISDENARPAVGVQIQLLRASYNAIGQRTFQSGGQTSTNDRGEYRLFWVTPGHYYLSAGPRSGPIQSVEFGVGGSLNGVQQSYAATYYPGVADIKAASAIEVQPGVELNGMDLAVSRQPLYRVRGSVIDSRTGQRPAAVSLSFSSRAPTGGGITQTMTQNYNASEGTFEFRDIAPGTYGVIAQIADSSQPGLPPSGGPPRPTAVAAVTVANANLDGVVLTVAMGVSLPGRMIVEGQEISTVVGLDRIRVQLTNPDGPTLGAPTPQAQPVNADGTFREDNTLPGQYRVAVAPMPPDFYLKEARFNQIDVLNKPLQFSGSVSTPLEIVLSPKAGQIDGTVTNDKLQPVSGTQAVLIPDQHRDRVDLYKTAVTDQAGHFTIRGITPGDYKVFAWEALEQFAYFDSDLLQRFEAQGKAVRISESDKMTADVKLIPAAP